MKKLLPAFMLLLSLSIIATAQNLTIEDVSGNDISNLTIDITGSVDDQELVEEMRVRNNSGNNIDVIFKKSIISLVENTENFICVGISCYPNSIMASSPFIVFAGVLQTDTASCHYRPNGHAGSSTIMYTFYNEDVVNFPDDSISVTVNYIVTSGVNEANSTKLELYPNPTSEFINFDYQISSINNSRFSIYNMLGKKVKSVELVDLQAKLTIPVDELESGIYFYSVTVNNEVIQTNRLIINR